MWIFLFQNLFDRTALPDAAGDAVLNKMPSLSLKCHHPSSVMDASCLGLLCELFSV